jgi:DNA invertase Pin-like site-specific DNA recombinase
MASEGDADLDDAVDDVGPDRSAVTDAAPEETVALYCRVSTDEQNLDRQREIPYEYATERLGVPPSAIEVYIDKGSGTNTDRRGYADLMASLESSDVNRVVVSEVSQLSRLVRDFAASVERIVDEYDAALHVLDMGLDLDPNERDPYTRAFLSVAATFAELEAEIKRQNTVQGLTAAREQGKHTGRAPFGFDVGPEGYLSPNEDFDTAVVILNQLDRGDSKRSIAQSAGVSRSTVGRIEARRDIYQGDN